jgi:glutamate formiminotransferase/formiminotetrahydrofolate cyclodeaminase
MKEIALQAAALVSELSALVPRDAAAYGAVMAAHKLPGDAAEDAATKRDAVTTALLAAAEVPLETARACVRVLELAAAVAARGNQNAVSDAGVAALLAEAACRGAVYNVRINVSALEDKSKGARLVEECGRLLEMAAERRQSVTVLVERAIGQDRAAR